MYILFGMALVPVAVLEVRAMAYFFANPHLLQVRDAGLEAPALPMTVPALYLLIPAAITAVYVFVGGSRTAKKYAAALVFAFCATVSLAYIASQFRFNTPARLYLEAIPIVLFVVLTIILLVLRLMKGRSSA